MITNKKNLPETFVKVLERDCHKSADYSASQLTKPVQMVHLEKRHREEIEEDVTDRIWALFGQAVHAILQKGETENQLVEGYLKETVDGVVLSGMSDLYEDGKISDYKVTSAWSWVFIKDKIPEYESQLNTYAWLFEKAGFPVKALEIVMILRDWIASKAKYDAGYPDCQVQVIQIKLWPMEKREEYIKSRVRLYEKYKDYPDAELPNCTPEDRWAKASTFAVMKSGRKTALKVEDSREAAKEWMKKNFKGEYIEERKGDEWKRCEYCSVSAFCNQFQNRG